ncbi:MAG: hypothetical protein RQ756_06125, partial [Flavobacteriaceae bacterium]|nr:hypothetical protein [Flavobacteriaceae bacterium]
MKKLLLLLCVFSFSAGAYAQLEATWWYFGRAAGMKFTNNQNPVGVTDANPALNQDEGTATISSSNGDLLFYTDGRTVWNANHVEMQNGAGLLGNISAAQSGVIVPFPGNTFPDRYAIFTVGIATNGLRYNVVDMNLDNGLGGILPGLKNVPLILGTPEMVNAVERQGGGGTGPETWVVT